MKRDFESAVEQEDKDLTDIIDSLQSRSKQEIAREYAAIPTGDHALMVRAGVVKAGWMQLRKKKASECAMHGIQPTNVVKNRYSNICPFDQFRVGLGDGQDYLNASFATVNEETFIISQAPLHPDYHGPDTCGDFWQAVWERDVSTIVCLAKVQSGFSGSSCYFPTSVDKHCLFHSSFTPTNASKERYGYHISLASQQALTSDVTKRVFSLERVGSPSASASSTTSQASISAIDSVAAFTETAAESKTRDIVQYHFEGWPNYGVPESTESVRAIIKDWETSYKMSPLSPGIPTPKDCKSRWTHTWVHCSGGVGRSGVFLTAVATLRALVKNPPRQATDVSPISATLALRRQRHPWCVEGPEQYAFCYRIIVDALSDKFPQVKK